ncbi:MAG TPA: G1 family glutamic endopeptidase [Streptosporangiaceae bacterium]
MPALGLVMASGPAAGASTVPAAPAASAAQYATALATARAAIQHLSIGGHATDHAVASHRVGPNLAQVQSTNWSGYADTGSGFSTATGSWTEPSASCTGSTSLAAFWVGIDGFTSNTVEQDGTLIECSGGRAFNFSWWEMFPANAVQVVGQSVAAGDHISASVSRSSTSYTLRVTDSTHTANSFSTTQRCSSSCANTSAEWIAEAPSGSGGVEPLSDFHTWTESGATVNGGVISSFADDEITMVNSSGQVKAQPGPLNSSGNGFSVTWVRST